MTMIRFGIAELYCGASGKTGYYNSQEIGLARAMKKLGYRCYIFYPAPDAAAVTEEDVEEHIDQSGSCHASLRTGHQNGSDRGDLQGTQSDAV